MKVVLQLKGDKIMMDKMMGMMKNKWVLMGMGLLACALAYNYCL